jgi:hypothetical protein
MKLKSGGSIAWMEEGMRGEMWGKYGKATMTKALSIMLNHK